MRMRGADVMASLLDGQANRFDAPRLAYKARLTLAHNRAAARKTSAALAKACAGCRRQTAQHPPRCACAADTASPPRPGWQIPVAPLARRGGRACHRCRRSLGGNTMPILKKKDWLSDRVRASQKVVAPATDRVGNNQPLATN